MKKLAVCLLCCLCSTAYVFAAERNTLIEREVFPASNPSFEDNLKDWGGQPADEYTTVDAHRVGPAQQQHAGNRARPDVLAIRIEAHVHWRSTMTSAHRPNGWSRFHQGVVCG